MSETKVLTYVGILIAVNTAFWDSVKESLWLVILLNITTVLFCALLTYIEIKITHSNRKWIDKIVYFFTKNDLDYVVEKKTVNYEIISKNNATYSLLADIKVTSEKDNFHYNGKYVWDQKEEILVSVNDPKEYRYVHSDALKWSNVDIYPTKPIAAKGDKYSVGFSLNNLVIGKLSKHSFLSCKVMEKIKFLHLEAKVDPNLLPSKTATLEIQNHLGIPIAKDESVPYDEATKSYKKTLKYPRKGRKYIIHWNYDKND